MDVHRLLGQATDNITVKRVFGDPLEHDGCLVIPVAKVRGGVGGGGDGAEDEGGGAGLGFAARPMGVFRVRSGAVSWHPATDVNRIVLGGQLVGIALLLTVRSILTRRRG